ncbi:glycine--tRNA ligase [Candidatus Dependentiae bacterium]|nr:MAG: glycine--tRNA ligase [Candidatus Dependentiae bacterium]
MSVTLENIVSLCKRRGFIYPSAEIYGGLNGVYDTGHFGVLMKENIRAIWKKSVALAGYQTIYMEGSLLGPETLWQASGHVSNFHDPMIDCLHCKKRYRADDINIEKPCIHCGNKHWTDVRQFNLMFKTELGAAQGNTSLAYLRPETAQAIFVNFKNVYSSNRVKIPFGIAQVGKAFRNEITPKQFLFRMREFEQMEVEWFCHPNESIDFFEQWCQKRKLFYEYIGLNLNKIRFRPHAKDELSHYSKQTTDIEYEFPFGWKELEGIAHRGDFDLTQHSKNAGKDLSIFDEETKSAFMPHVVECSVGLDRLFLTLLFDAYHTETVEGEDRIVLKLHPRIAPVKAVVLPLVKKLTDNAMPVFNQLEQKGFHVLFDDSGSIGKRYRRYDEIGVPVCFTFDFNSIDDHCVTARNRDTLQQERISINSVGEYMLKLLL